MVTTGIVGVTMSMGPRRDLMHFADQHNVGIMEDDYDSEYRHADRPLEPLHRLDRHGRVIYVGTFSKTLSPSLRLGFMCCLTHWRPLPLYAHWSTGSRPRLCKRRRCDSSSTASGLFR